MAGAGAAGAVVSVVVLSTGGGTEMAIGVAGAAGTGAGAALLGPAAVAAAAGKKAMTDEANAAVATIEDGWKNLETTAKKVEKNMKDKKADWAADVKAFAEGLKATKDMIAADAAGAKAKAGELKTTIIDKWDATFKELAAVPAKTEEPKKK